MRRVLLLTFFLFVNVSLLANDDVWTFTENVSGIDMSFVITSNTEGNRTVKVEKRKNKEDYDNNPFYNDIPAIDPNTEGPVTIPEKVTHNGVEYKVTEIGYSAFGDCKKITSVKLPSSIQKIDVFAFADVTFETITLPEGLTTLEGAAFLDSKIKYVEIPSTVTIFGKTGNVETEGPPFSDYGMMEYIKFKSSNIEFGDYSMFYNENTVIIMEAETPPVVSKYVFYDSAHNPASFSKIIVPDGSKEAYQSANFWTDFKSKIYAKSEYTDYTIVTDPIIILSETSFTYDGTPKTPTVTVKDGNTVIPESEYTVTYSNNTEVGSARVIISNNEGGNYIVNGSATFTIVKDPDGIIVFASDKVKAACVAKWDKEKDGVKDGELSYAEAAAVTSLVDENDWNDPFAELSVDDSEFSFDEFQYFIGVTSLIGYEFGDCENLTSIILPNSITSIGDGAFYRCKKLTSIHIPASVTDIFMTNNSELSPSPAFNSEYLQTITVDPENTKYASPTGSNVIIDTESNTLILGCGNTDFSKIPNTVTTIGQDAFAGVTFGNPKVSLPTTVTGIMEYAFRGSNITSINLGELSNLTTIGKQAFSDCTGLTEVTLPAGITEMGISVFGDCDNIVKVVSKMENPINNQGDNHIIETYNDAVLYVPQGKVETYRSAGWEEILYDVELKSFRAIIDGDGTLPDAIEGLTYNGKDQKLIIPGTYRDGMMEYSLDGETYSTSVPTGKNAGDYTVYYRKVGESAASTLTATIEYTFTAQTTEDIEIVFTVLDETAKTCQVGYLDGSFNKPAVDRDAVEGPLTIPESVNGYTVVKIGKYAFDNTIKMTSVTIPATVTSIDDNAFYNCNGLTSFELPANVSYLGTGSLASLRSVTSLKVAEGNTVYDSRGDCNAIIETATNKLLFGSNITTIPADVPEIGEFAFRNLVNYTLTIPSTVTKIDDNAFYFCSNWTLQVENATPLQINENVFGGMSNSTTLRVPAGSKSAYAEATGWKNFGDIVEVTGKFVNVATAGSLATKITSDEKFTITDLTITGQLNGTDFRLLRAMAGNDYTGHPTNGKLQKLDLSGVTIVEGGDTYFESDGIYRADGSKAAGKGSKSLSTGNYVVGPFLFAGCTQLSEVKIPSSTKEIGDWAFMMTNISALDIPEGVEKMWASFSYNTRVSTITIPSSVTDIMASSWQINPYLSSIIVDSNNSKYDSRNNCNAIMERSTNTLVLGCKNTIIPDDTKIIGSYAFSGDIGESLTLPQGLQTIKQGAFNSSSIKNIAIPASVSLIEDEAFVSCYNLATITVDASNATYESPEGSNAIIVKSSKTLIVGCKSTIIPSDVKAIGAYVFNSCNSMASITIPASIESIGDYAFGYCHNLTSVTVEAVEPFAINETVFSGTNTNATLYVPAGSKAKYKAATGWKDFNEIIETISVFSGTNLWAGYVAVENFALPTGLKAYVITSLDATTATASPLDYIPQGVPVLLKRENTSDNNFEMSAGSGTAPTVNLLKTYESAKNVSNREGFILYNDEFVLVNEGTLPAGRVFLPANKSGIALTRGIVTEGDDTTGIYNSKMDFDDSDKQWYDLQGRKLERKPTKKGIYILDGRKVVIK